jgi:hypothetical protein
MFPIIRSIIKQTIKPFIWKQNMKEDSVQTYFEFERGLEMKIHLKEGKEGKILQSGTLVCPEVESYEDDKNEELFKF